MDKETHYVIDDDRPKIRILMTYDNICVILLVVIIAISGISMIVLGIYALSRNTPDTSGVPDRVDIQGYVCIPIGIICLIIGVLVARYVCK